MLIVEGADNIGKTTLCRVLVDKINAESSRAWTYSHATKFPHNFDFCNDYVSLIRRRAVQDRFHLSELAYNKTPRLTDDKLAIVQANLLLNGAYVVVLTATDERIAHNWKDEREMFSISEARRANNVFRSLATDPLHRNVIVDFHWRLESFDDYPTANVSTIMKIIGKYKQRQEFISSIRGEASPFDKSQIRTALLEST